jgi:hypothetical protein
MHEIVWDNADDCDLPSYSGSKFSRTLLAIFGFLPMMTVGIADISRAVAGNDGQCSTLNEVFQGK